MLENSTKTVVFDEPSLLELFSNESFQILLRVRDDDEVDAQLATTCFLEPVILLLDLELVDRPMKSVRELVMLNTVVLECQSQFFVVTVQLQTTVGLRAPQIDRIETVDRRADSR